MIIFPVFRENLSSNLPRNLILVYTNMFSDTENKMGSVSKPSDNRVAKFANFSKTLLINRIETWFWCSYLNRMGAISNLSDQQGCHIWFYRVAIFPF